MATDVGSAVGYLDLDISGFLAGLKSAQSEADKASKNVATKIGNNIQSAGKSMTSAGQALTAKVTTPIVGLGTAIVKTSADFESAMSKVSAISGATGNDLDTLKEKAREMGAKTKFSATESAEAFQYMAMAGWKTGDMLDGIEGIMNLAAADGLDLATTSDIVTDALTAFGLSAKDSSHFADVLAKASSSANTNVSMLGESFKYAAPVAGALGYSAEDTAIALGLMANSGIKASQGGTALRTMLTNLAKPTDDIADAMSYLGISLENNDGSMKSLMEVMQNLRSSFGQCKMPMDEFQKQLDEITALYESGEMTEKKYDAALEDLTEKAYGAEGALKAKYAATIAGKEGMSGLLAIVSAADSDFDSLTESIYNADGAAEQMADTMLDNLSGQITILMSSLQELALQFGEIIVPYVKKFVDKIQELVTKFQKLSPEQKNQIVKWAAIAASIGPVLMILGKLTSSVGSIITTFGKIPGAIKAVTGGFTKLTTAGKNVFEGFKLAKAGFTALGAQASPLGAALAGVTAPMIAIVAAVALVAAAFVSLLKNNEEFRSKTAAIWDGIKSKFESFAQGIVDRLNALGFDFENFSEVAKAVWEGFCSLLAPIFEAAFSIVSSVLGTVLDALTGILDVFIGIFTGNWEQCWNGIKEIFTGILNGLTGILQSVGNMLLGIFNAICGWFGTTWDETWSSIKQFFVDVWDGIVSFFSNAANSIKTTASDFVTVIVSFFESLPYNVGYFIGNTLANVITWSGNMVAKAREMGTNFISSVVSFFVQLPGNILQFITSAFNNVQMWAVNMPSKAREMGANFVNNVASFMQQLPGIIKQYLDSALNNLRIWVTQMGQKGREAVQSLINNVVSAASGIANKVMSIGSDIVAGVWNGIQGAAGWFTDQVKDFFSGIVDGVKDTLGIGSPSKVFRDEIGRWLPPGVVQGFEAAMPSAMKMIQKVLNSGIGKIDVNSISVGAGVMVSGFADKLKSIYNDVALWFESIGSRIGNSVNGMMQSLDMLIRAGQVIVNSDGTLGYIGYNGFTRSGSSDNYVDRDNPQSRDTSRSGDTFIFNSPKAIDEIEAARQMKKTKRDMAEGF